MTKLLESEHGLVESMVLTAGPNDSRYIIVAVESSMNIIKHQIPLNRRLLNLPKRR